MSLTATAQAIEPEPTFTVMEACAALSECSPHCAAMIALAAVEHWRVAVLPLGIDNQWGAGCFVGRDYVSAHGGTPVVAVENLLRKIGETNG